MNKGTLVIFALLLFSSCSPTSSENTTDGNPYSIDTQLIEQIYLQQFGLENKKIANVPLTSETNEIKSWSEIVKNGSIMVFFISEISCFDCVVKQIRYIAAYLSNNNKLPIVLISSSESIRSVYSVLVKYGLELPIYTTKYKDLGFERELHPGPLFFIIGDKLTTRFYYEPLINNELITRNYLSRAKEIYFSHNNY
ncbi:MAG: hypothetical protein U9N86_00100 [Bacteroidota bacterium]|nr:hypothetical protein [Bacteroidota bacterium]